jgi:hypothetical protein
MSTAGVFKLIANEGKADQMILSTNLLNQRLADITNVKNRSGLPGTPTLVDIERTHILYVSAHFKPYAAIAFEYNKVKPQNGNIAFGSSMQFSIPQFGDFFNDMVVLVKIGQARGNRVVFPSRPVYIENGHGSSSCGDSDDTDENDGCGDSVCGESVNCGGGGGNQSNSKNPFLNVVFTKLNSSLVIENQSSSNAGKLFYGKKDCPVWVGISYAFTDFTGVRLPFCPDTGLPRPDFHLTNLIKFCEFPGLFLFSKVAFDVNGNPLDAYTSNATTINEKYSVPLSKRYAYNAMNGQQNVLSGTGGLFTSSVVDQEYSNGSVNGNQIGAWDAGQADCPVGLFGNVIGTPIGAVRNGNSGTVLLNAPSARDLANPKNAQQGQVDVGQNVIQVTNGPQTPKPVQPPLSMWISLNFWFNKDVRLSIPSVSIPYGQRFITITTSDLQSTNKGSLLHESPAAYLCRTIYYNSVDPTQKLTRISQCDTIKKNYLAWGEGDMGTRPGYPGMVFDYKINSTLTVQPTMNAELYINNIFVNPEIHDIYIKRIGFSLIRVHREQTTSITSSGRSETLLSSLKWPIEYMFAGLRPNFNTNTSQNSNSWRDWHRFSRELSAFPEGLMSGNYSESLPTSSDNSNDNVVTTFIAPKSIQRSEYFISSNTINQLSLVSHGINIYDITSSSFYNSYLPYRYNDCCNTSSLENEPSLMFINFALFPGSYQPSGHLNISRARETYIVIDSTHTNVSANSSSSYLLIINASAINFLLISDGSAILRYST